MLENNKLTSNYKKLWIAMVVSPIIAYFIITYNTFRRYQRHDSNYNISIEHFIKTAKYMAQDIEIAFLFLSMAMRVVPILIIFPILYIFVFYKVFVSTHFIFSQCKTLWFTAMLVALYLFLDYLSGYMIA
ncbi:MAG: hypothetical protein Q4P13_10790 [Psychrobacter sp.]|nr:hypothetical protein [Psychrobacter sp.]